MWKLANNYDNNVRPYRFTLVSQDMSEDLKFEFAIY